MKRADFERLVEEALAQLPERFRGLMENVAVIIRDRPPRSRRSKGKRTSRLLLGVFAGVPRTQKSLFSTAPPDRIVLYQKNIEAVCETPDEIREEVRLTVLHEVGHYFGLSEEDLADV